MTIGREMKKP